MLERQPCVVITFKNTPDACAMEAAAKGHGIPGQLIPIPSAISAGCGLAWRAGVEERAAVVGALAEHGIAHEGVFDIEL